MNSLIDLTLGLNNQAIAVLHFLKDEELSSEDFHTSTSAWYNCRERGFVLSIKSYRMPTGLYIAVFEHRNSDEICALKWEAKSGVNPPTIESDGRLAYHGGDKFNVAFSVGYGEVGKMATWVRDQAEKYVAENAEKTKR